MRSKLEKTCECKNHIMRQIAIFLHLNWRHIIKNINFQILTVSVILPLNKIILLKGVFAKNERGYRLNAIKKRF